MSKEENFEGVIKIYLDCLEVVKKKDFKAKIHYNIAVAFKRIGNVKQAVAHGKLAVKYLPELTKASALVSELTLKSA